MQTHDYNPGYMGGWPEGVFWTAFSGAETMSVDPETGNAFYAKLDLDIPDYVNSINALANGPTQPGNVSFDLRWFPSSNSRRWIYNHPSESSEPDSYALDYWNTSATLEWEAQTEGGFSFASYKIGQYPEGRSPGQFFAVAGRERSGAFYQPWTLGDSGPDSSGRSRQPSVLAETGGGGRMMGAGTLAIGAAMLVALRRRGSNREV